MLSFPLVTLLNSSPIAFYSHFTDPPDSITVPDFIFGEDGVRRPHSKSKNPFTCGISGKTYTTAEVIERQKLLARALAKRLGYDIREGTEWDRVVALYSVNTVRTTLPMQKLETDTQRSIILP